MLLLWLCFNILRFLLIVVGKEDGWVLWLIINKNFSMLGYDYDNDIWNKVYKSSILCLIF